MLKNPKFARSKKKFLNAISKNTLKSIHNRLRFQIGKQNNKILKKLYQNINSTKKSIVDMQLNQKSEFSERLKIIFKEDFEDLYYKFLGGEDKVKLLKTKIREKTLLINCVKNFNFENNSKPKKNGSSDYLRRLN
jgi:hypothetical protein